MLYPVFDNTHNLVHVDEDNQATFYRLKNGEYESYNDHQYYWMVPEPWDLDPIPFLPVEVRDRVFEYIIQERIKAAHFASVLEILLVSKHIRTRLFRRFYGDNAHACFVNPKPIQMLRYIMLSFKVVENILAGMSSQHHDSNHVLSTIMQPNSHTLGPNNMTPCSSDLLDYQPISKRAFRRLFDTISIFLADDLFSGVTLCNGKTVFRPVIGIAFTSVWRSLTLHKRSWGVIVEILEQIYQTKDKSVKPLVLFRGFSHQFMELRDLPTLATTIPEDLFY